MKRIIINLPAKTYKKLEKQAKRAGFEKVSEYVKLLIEEALEEGISKKEEKLIKERLRALGYI